MTHLSKVTRAFSQNPLAKRKLDVFLTKNGNFLLPLLCHVASGTMVVRQRASNEMALVPTQVVGKGKQLRLHVPDSDKVLQDNLIQLQASGRPKRTESMVECVSGGPKAMQGHGHQCKAGRSYEIAFSKAIRHSLTAAAVQYSFSQ